MRATSGSPQIPLVQEVFGNFRQETRRLLHPIAAGIAEAGADERVAQIKLVPRPRDGHVKQPAFLLLALAAFHRARGRKHAVAEHDGEHDIELQALRLMDGRELDFFRVVRALVVLGLDVGEQGELRQEILDAAELKGELGELLQFIQPALVIVVSLLQIIVVAGVHHQPEHLGGAFADRLVLQLRDRGDELRPGRRRLFGNGFGNLLQRNGKVERTRLACGG